MRIPHQFILNKINTGILARKTRAPKKSGNDFEILSRCRRINRKVITFYLKVFLYGTTRH